MASLSAANLFNVKDMVFVVTGAGSGIGLMMARALDANGAAKVYILGRRMEKLKEAAKSAANGTLIPLQCDVTSKDSLSAAASHISSQTPYINALIANSGISGPTLEGLPPNPSLAQLHSHLWSVPAEAFTETFAVNTTAPFYSALAFLPLLEAGNTHADSPGTKIGVKSQVVITGSIAGFNRKATAGFAYGASKAGVTHLMKMMAHYFAPFRIRVNVLAPGLYPSEMTAHRFQGKDPTVEGNMAAEEIPLARTGSEEDMAGAILFLCSRAGGYVTGNAVISDGGRLSIMPATY